jgi:Fic family protein
MPRNKIPSLNSSSAPKSRYIWQEDSWPSLTFSLDALSQPINSARIEQSRLLGLLEAIGLVERQSMLSSIWIDDALSTAAIEGEILSATSVKSSVHKRLGIGKLASNDRSVEGLLDILEDACVKHAEPLTNQRLFQWHIKLFSTTPSRFRETLIGEYRTHIDAMEIVSGLPGREVVHYRAPPSKTVSKEMKAFLQWFEQSRHIPKNQLNGLVRAAMAHLWFETIHPFEDGNGRLGRAIVDLALAQDLGEPIRALSLSKQFLDVRKNYYDALNTAQRGSTDITDWILWFLQNFTLACQQAQKSVRQAIAISDFWRKASHLDISPRQAKVLRRLIDAGDGGFLGGMTADKYIKLTKVSKATATRDLTHLLSLDLLQTSGQGKATRYAVNVVAWNTKAPPPPPFRE